MTGCAPHRHDLGAYVLAGLEPADVPALEAHLAVCAECQAEHAELAGAPRLLARALDAPPPVPGRVRDRVVADAARRRARRRWTVTAAAAALLAALVGGVVGWQLAPAPPREVAVPLEAVDPFDGSGWAAFRTEDAAVLVRLELAGLEPLTAPEVYEAWLSTTDGRIVSIGQLPAGEGTVELTAQGPIEDYRGFWITAEPDRRDPAHDGPTVLRAPVPR